MSKYHIIIALIVIALLVLLVVAGLGIAAYMKGGFSNISFMVKGESELDKLIKKINSYLKG